MGGMQKGSADTNPCCKKCEPADCKPETCYKNETK